MSRQTVVRPELADARQQGLHNIGEASELSGVSNLLFRRNSLPGTVEVLPRAGGTVELNAALHAT